MRCAGFALGAFVVVFETAHAGEPLAQDHTIAYHNPDREYYVAGVGFERLSDGTLIAVVPVIPRPAWNLERRATHSATHIISSRDGGRSWQPQAKLPYYSAVPSRPVLR